MKKKRLLSTLLVAAMTVSLAACGGSDDGAVTNNAADGAVDSTEAVEGTEAVASERPDAPMGQLVIGSLEDLEQDFYDPAFNNSSTNYKVQLGMLHGGAPVGTTKEGEWVVNKSIASDVVGVDNEDGTKTYTVTLNDGLVWSDGSPLTAKDYVFAMLLESSPEMMGVDNYAATNYTELDGWDEFNSGETKAFRAAHLIDDKTFSVTIAAAELPNHYDFAKAGIIPRPMAVIAPGCDIEETEDGATITGEFTTDVLLETINNTDTGYRYNPQVVCGPYKLESYDPSSKQGVFVVNENFAGNVDGVKPVIQKVIIKTVTSDTRINELKAGTVDLLMSVSGGTEIEAGLDLVDAGEAQKHTYFRYGYGLIKFDCSQFPTDSENVRQAIAYCLDRNEFARQYSGGYATIVHSEYGLSQWEYQDSKDWIDENLNTYEKDIEKAKEVLAADGWNLNADGAEYKDGDGLRYKEVDGELKPLVIQWCNSENNPVSELLSTMLPEALREAGMELKATTTDFPTLISAIEHKGENTYNMFNLATGFSTQQTYWHYYSMDEKYLGSLNENWIQDEELAAAATALKSIPMDDKETWLSTWRDYQKVWNRKLPNIPLYSDEYHDFFNAKLQGWDTNPIWDWTDALIEAWVTE